MKLNKIFYGVALSAIMGGFFAACTNELGDPSFDKGDGVIRLVRDPEVIAWSGNQTLTPGTDYATRGYSMQTRATETPWERYKKVQDYDNKTSWSDWDIQNDPYYPYKDNAPSKSADRGESVSQAEYEFVMEYIRTHEGGTECNLNTYFIQNVGSSNDHYIYDYHDSQNNVDRRVEFTGGNQMDYLVIGDYHIGDYNASGGPRALCINMPINAPEISPTYHDSWGTLEQTKENAYRFYLITLPDDPIYGGNAGKTAYYLGFDYKTKKWDNGDIDYNGDGIYNDWVVKIMPANGVLTPPTPGTGTCDKCGHPSHDETCDKCQEDGEGGCYVGPETPEEPNKPETPETPDNDDNCGDCKHPDHPLHQCNDPKCTTFPCNWGILFPGLDMNGFVSDNDSEETKKAKRDLAKHYNEVEVNLSINDLHSQYEIENLVSKLSIHVRYPHDVQVRIPVSPKYYIPADDLYILNNHEFGNFEYGSNKGEAIEGLTHTIEYSINNNPVTLTVEYVNDTEEGANDGYIQITTKGINAEVIRYCLENYGDGINFEIYNYFCVNEEINDKEGQAALKELFKDAYITFDVCNPQREDCKPTYPWYYINAFNNVGENQTEFDCEVGIDPDQKEEFENYYENQHLNGSPYNWIYMYEHAYQIQDENGQWVDIYEQGDKQKTDSWISHHSGSSSPTTPPAPPVY